MTCATTPSARSGVRPCGVLECVVNISEGRDADLVARLAGTAGEALLDVHRDAHHNRSVLTLVGEEAPRTVARAAVEALDLGVHEGVHPRIGVVDVVPFVPLAGDDLAAAIGARDRFATWLADELGVPSFVYGPERTLPEVRRGAFVTLTPDHGPAAPHPTAGATAVGARPVLVAYNLWLSEPDVGLARQVAAQVRGPSVRALGLQVGSRVQVSLNLVDPAVTGPAAAFDLVDRAARAAGTGVAGAELVGLLPEAVLRAVDEARWEQLDLAAARTIEARLAAVGFVPPGGAS